MSVTMTMPRILIDTREQTPLTFPDGVPTARATLRTGDYSIEGYTADFTVERKSLADLVNTVIHDRERFERELERMTAYQFRRVLVVAPYYAVSQGAYSFSRANPKAVVASVNAFEVRYGVPFVFAANPDEAARRLVNWAWYFVREVKAERERASQPSDGGGGVLGRLADGVAQEASAAVSDANR